MPLGRLLSNKQEIASEGEDMTETRTRALGAGQGSGAGSVDTYGSSSVTSSKTAPCRAVLLGARPDHRKRGLRKRSVHPCAEGRSQQLKGQKQHQRSSSLFLRSGSEPRKPLWETRSQVWHLLSVCSSVGLRGRAMSTQAASLEKLA